MGIKDLNKSIQKHAPNAFQKIDVSEFEGKNIAIDANGFFGVSKAVIAAKITHTLDLKTGHVDRELALHKMKKAALYNVLYWRRNKINPIYNFDGEAPKAKHSEQISRRVSRDIYRKDLSAFLIRLNRINNWQELLKDETKAEEELPKILQNLKDLEKCIQTKNNLALYNILKSYDLCHYNSWRMKDLFDENGSLKVKDPESLYLFAEQFRLQKKHNRSLKFTACSTKEILESLINDQQLDEEANDRYYKCIRYSHSYCEKKELESLRIFLIEIGVTVKQANTEGEKLACMMAKQGLAFGVFSQDTDCIAYGAPIMITGLGDKLSCCVYKTVLKEMDFTEYEFLNFCIMLGCDYNKRIRGKGPDACFKAITKHRSLKLYAEEANVDITCLNRRVCLKLFKDVDYNQLIIEEDSSPGFDFNVDLFREQEEKLKKYNKIYVEICKYL